MVLPNIILSISDTVELPGQADAFQSTSVEIYSRRFDDRENNALYNKVTWFYPHHPPSSPSFGFDTATSPSFLNSFDNEKELLVIQKILPQTLPKQEPDTLI